MLTELILENTLASYDPEEVVALLSCFIFQEKTDVEPVIPPKLKEGLDAIMAIAERVGSVQDAHKVPGEEFRTLKFGLVEVVYEWAKGMVRVAVYQQLPPHEAYLRLSMFFSHSSRLLILQMSRKALSCDALRGWMRHAGKYAMLPESLATQSCSKRWRKHSSRSRETVSFFG